jgi:anti-anti-sigma factor
MDANAKDDGAHLWWTANGQGRIAHLSGEIDLANAHDLFAAIRTGWREPGPLTVDLTHVTFLDSTGVAELVQLAGRTALHVVCRPDSAPRRVLEITGIDSLMTVVDRVDALAVGKSQGQPG